MLTTLEKAKTLKEFRGLRVSLVGGTLKTLEKAKSLKRFRELRVLLGGEKVAAITKDYSQLFNDILNDTVNVFTNRDKFAELEQAANDLGGDDMPDGQNKDLLLAASTQAAIQMLKGYGYEIAA